MSGWRKSDSKSNAKPDASRQNSAKSSATHSDSAPAESTTPKPMPGGWRKGGTAASSSSAAQTKTGWRGSRVSSSPARPPSKRRWLLVAVGLAFIFFAVWFVDMLWKRDQLIDVVLYQRGVDSSEIENKPIALMPLSQQWARADRNNCRVTYFHRYKDYERTSPLLFVVQSEVDANDPKNAVKEVLEECLEKINDNTMAVVVLDLYSTPSTTPLLNYKDPANAVGQYTDHYEDVVAVWEELLQTAEVKASRKKLVLLLANSTKYAQAWGAPELNGSVLQSFVVDALSNTECDANGDNAVTLAELETFVGQRVADWVAARRAAIQTPKLLLVDDSQRKTILYKRVSDNWVNRFIGNRRKKTDSTPIAVTENGIDIVKGNWNKIDSLWSKYESLMSRKVYRWAPERMMRIAQGLTTLEHFAERVDIEKQSSASRLLRTVKFELDACPVNPPSRIDFDMLGVKTSAQEGSQNTYDTWAKWTGDLPKYLDNPPNALEAKPTGTDGTGKDPATVTKNEPQNGVTTSAEDTKSEENTQPDFNAMDRRFLAWQAALQAPIDCDPKRFKRFLDVGLSNADFSSPAPTLHFLSLLQNDSYWYKSNTIWDTLTKKRFGETLGRSLSTLGLWMKLVFVERRPDAVLKLSNSLDEASIEVQNQLVDSWLAGKNPTDDALAELEVRLKDLSQSLETWEAAYDARDEYYLSRPYFVCWLAAASEFADSSAHTSLEQLSNKIKELDEALANFGKTSDQLYAAQLVERWITVRDEYRRLSLSKLPADGSMPSEESFVWLRVTRSVPVALDDDGRRDLRAKMVEYISGKANIEVGKGDGEGKSDETRRKVANDKRSVFINDLAAKFPHEKIIREREIPKDDITSQARWLRSPVSLLYQDVYETSTQASSAHDEGGDVWQDLVEDHSQWLQTLVIQHMTWGNGGGSEQLRPFYQRLAQACEVVSSEASALGNVADSTTESAQRLQESLKKVDETLSRFGFDINGNTKFTYNPNELPSGGLKYPIKLTSSHLDSWGNVEKLSCWIDSEGSSQPVAAFQANFEGKDAYSFSMSELVDTGIRGEVWGSFRGNQFHVPIVIQPQSLESVATDLRRNTGPAKLTVQGINAPKLNVVFLIDESGSMNQAAPSGEKVALTRLRQAEQILENSVKLFEEEYLKPGIVKQVNVGLVLFGKVVKVNQQLVDLEKFEPVLPQTAEGTTSLVDGYRAAIELLKDRTGEECLVIGITDGVDTSGPKEDSKDFDTNVGAAMQKCPHVQCLLFQAATREAFIAEFEKQNPDMKAEARKRWGEQWDKAQQSLMSLQKKSGGRFVWFTDDEINTKNMMEQINSILPGTEVTVDGTSEIKDRKIALLDYAILPNSMLQASTRIKGDEALRQWADGIGGWNVVVEQRNRGLAGDKQNRRGITGKYGPFPVWGGENVQLIFDQKSGLLYRKDNDVQPASSEQMWDKQWIAPRLLEGRDGVSVSIDFGCEETRPVDRPELIFVEQIQNGNKLPALSDFVYKLSFSAQHSASFVETNSRWVQRKTPTEKVRVDHRIWTVRRSKSLSGFFLPTIGPISKDSSDSNPVELGEAWRDQKAPEVVLKRKLQSDQKKEQLEITLRGERASEWFVAVVGNVWEYVNVEIATDKSRVVKTYHIADGFIGQPLQVVLISADQLQQMSDESTAKNDGAVELFEFESLVESSR